MAWRLYKNWFNWESDVLTEGFKIRNKEGPIVKAIDPNTSEDMGIYDRRTNVGTLNTRTKATRKNPRPGRFDTLKAWKQAVTKSGGIVKQGTRKNYLLAMLDGSNIGSWDKKKKRGSLLTRFEHEHIRPTSAFAKGSIRTVTKKRGKKKIEVRVGCPKGHYSKKTQRCKVGTRAVSVLRENPEHKYLLVAAKGRTIWYWDGNKFNLDRRKGKRYNRESAQMVGAALRPVVKQKNAGLAMIPYDYSLKV